MWSSVLAVAGGLVLAAGSTTAAARAGEFFFGALSLRNLSLARGQASHKAARVARPMTRNITASVACGRRLAVESICNWASLWASMPLKMRGKADFARRKDRDLDRKRR